jgi:SAM-dependent methyltransferase
MPAHLDAPPPGSVVDPLCVPVRGWVWLGSVHADLVVVEVHCGEVLIGSTRALYPRPDVNTALSLPPDTRTGFEIFAHHAGFEPAGQFGLQVTARLRDGSRTAPLATVPLTAIARDYRRNHFGVLLERETIAVQGRDNVFATGPSLADGSAELAALLRRHLGPPPRRILDVGCGVGSYGRGLVADGYDWLGVETRASDCAELARLGLPHRQVDGRTLPFADGAFEAALCIEVLEHIAETRPFLAEVSRVAPRQLIVSVPNCELLGYLWDYRATPWHMLEGDHKNFFTRWSLGALLHEFYAEVELAFHAPFPLATREGTPLHYNLLAIATGPR